MDIFGLHLSSFAAAAAAFVAVLGAFARFDKDQSDDNRKFVRDWLRGLNVDDRQWTTFFTNLFEKFFGAKHLSMKCVRRSFGLSIVLIILLLWAMKREFDFFGYEFNTTTHGVMKFVIFVVGTFLACGCITDYFSLWKTNLSVALGVFGRCVRYACSELSS